MDKNIMKIVLLIICFIGISFPLFSQMPDVGEISKKHGTIGISKYSRLSFNHASFVKNLYALHFNNGTVRIYDSDSDIIASKIFYHFEIGYGKFLGISENKWNIYNENDGDYTKESYKWEKIAELEKSRFDSIQILDFDHFIGFRNDKFILFNYDDTLDSLMGFKETIPIKRVINEAISDWGAYKDGIFVEIASPDTSKNKKIAYIDFETGKLKSQFLVDSIYNYPTCFVEYCTVRKDHGFLIYSYEQDKVIDSSFNQFHIVPLYDYPLIIKDGYIGLGDEREWIKLDIKNTLSIKFDQRGDYVYAMLEVEDGKIYNLDLWEKTFVLTVENKKIAPVQEPEKLIDLRDGNEYRTVKIGKQFWMAENLAYLPSVNSFGYNVFDYYENVVSEAKATENYNTYGVLYDWTTATEACPLGWHLPSDKEWKKLIKHLGGEIAGGKMKKIDTILWDSPNVEATNSSGFSALPGGYHEGYKGQIAYFWSSTESDNNNALDRSIGNEYGLVFRSVSNKENGYSVRCIKD